MPNSSSSAPSNQTPAPAAAPPATGAARLPVALNGGIEITGEALAALYHRTERGNGGFFPLGDSELFHCGAHIVGTAGDEVYSIADGEIVAARLSGSPGEHPWGDTGFVILRHPVKVGGAAKTIYSLYMQLKREPLNPDTTESGWLKRLLIAAMNEEDKKPKWRVLQSLPSWTDDAKGKFSPTNVQNDQRLDVGVYDQDDELILDHKHYVKLSGKWVRGAGGNGDAERIKEISPWADFDLETAKANSTLVASLADGKTAVFDSEKDTDGNHKWKVESGEVVGAIGTYLGAPSLHLSVFSTDAVFPEGALPDQEYGPYDAPKLNAVDISSKDAGTPEQATALISALDPRNDFLGKLDDKSIVDPTELRVFYRAPTHSWRSRYQSIKGLVDFNLDIDKLTKQDRYKSHPSEQVTAFKDGTKDLLFWKDLSSADDFPTDGVAVFVHPITAIRLMTSVAIPRDVDDPAATGGDDRLNANEDVILSVRDKSGAMAGLMVTVTLDGDIVRHATTDASGDILLQIEDIKGKDIQVSVSQDDIGTGARFISIVNETGGPVRLEPGVPASAQPFNANETVAKPTMLLPMKLGDGVTPTLYGAWDEEVFALEQPLTTTLDTNATVTAQRFVFRRDDGKYEAVEATTAAGARVYLWSIDNGTANLTAQPDTAVTQAAGSDPAVIATWSAEMAHVNDHPVLAGRVLNIDDGTELEVTFYGMRSLQSPEHDEQLTSRKATVAAGGFACDMDPAPLAQGTDLLNSARPVFATVKAGDKLISLRNQAIMIYAAGAQLPDVPPEAPSTDARGSKLVTYFQISRDGQVDKPTTWDNQPASTKTLADIADSHLKARFISEGGWDQFVVGPVTTSQHIALEAQRGQAPLEALRGQQAATLAAFPGAPAWLFTKGDGIAAADNGIAMGICALHCKDKLSDWGKASGCNDEIRTSNLSACKNAHHAACQGAVQPASGKTRLKVIGTCAQEPGKCGEANHDKSKCFLAQPVPGANGEERERWHIALPLRAKDAGGDYPYQGILRVLVVNPITGDAVVCSQEDRGPTSLSPGNAAVDNLGIAADDFKGKARVAGLSYEAAWKLGLNRNAPGDPVVMLAFVSSATPLGPVRAELDFSLRKQVTKPQLLGLEAVPDQLDAPAVPRKTAADEAVTNGAASKQLVPGPAPTPKSKAAPAPETRKLIELRQKLVDAATGEIGKVDDRGGDGGKRKGWKVLQGYLEAALKTTAAKEGWAQALQTPGRRAGGLAWSGIFAVWCAQKAGLKATWDLSKAEIRGLGATRADSGFSPGDILVLKGSPATFCVLTARSGDKLSTVGGDGPYQTIESRTRKVSDVTHYYRLSPDTFVA